MTDRNVDYFIAEGNKHYSVGRYGCKRTILFSS